VHGLKDGVTIIKVQPKMKTIINQQKLSKEELTSNQQERKG
jgi:hypothetical protein